MIPPLAAPAGDHRAPAGRFCKKSKGVRRDAIPGRRRLVPGGGGAPGSWQTRGISSLADSRLPITGGRSFSGLTLMTDEWTKELGRKKDLRGRVVQVVQNRCVRT